MRPSLSAFFGGRRLPYGEREKIMRGDAPIADPAEAPIDRTMLGNQAKRLLEDPVLMLAFDRVKRELGERWMATAVGDTQQREAAYRMIFAVEAVRTMLITMLGDAKVIAIEAERKAAADRRDRERRERMA